MADITISSVNYSGYNADFTFYPFTGGTISLGSHNIPYTRTSDNYEGVYEMDITWTDGIPVSCSVQIGASDCVDIETSGATYDYGGIYTYIGQGYLSYNSGTGQWAVICSDTDPKSAALYYLEGSNGQFLGNVFDVVARTTEPRITTFLLLIGLGCGSSTPFTPPSGVVSEIPTFVNGLPAVGTFPNGGDSGGTYTLVNNPTCDTGVDVDAAAYLADVVASGGTTNATIESAVNTLFTSLKSAGLYTKMAAMYPFVGGTAASHAINAKLNKSFDITWNGGMVHSISGSTGNGTNAYGDTNFSTTDFITTAQAAFGFYTNAADVGANGVNGGFFGSNRGIQIASNYSNNWGYRHGVGGFQQTANGGSNTGQFISVRTGTTEAQLYRNAVNIDTYTSSNQGLTTYPMLIFNMWASTLPGTFYSEERISFVFFANNLLYSEVSTLDGIINTFQTSLGRNTY